MGIHLLHYAHGNVQTRTYDAIHNIFVTIAQGANIHMGQEQLYVLPLAMFNSFINVMIIKDGIHTLVDVIIVDPTGVDLFP